MEDAPDYTAKRLDEMQHAFGGALARVRAELGISAFGVQIAELPPNSGELAPEHDHLHDGQEELYLLLEGEAVVTVGEDTVALDRETLVRVGPGERRRLRSGASGARVLMVGATPGRPYEPPRFTEIDGPEALGSPSASSSMSDSASAPSQHDTHAEEGAQA